MAGIRFTCFYHHETFSGKDKAEVSLDDAVADAQSKPEGAKPSDEKTEQRREAYGEGGKGKEQRQESEDERNGRCGHDALQRAESLMVDAYGMVGCTMDDRGAPESVFTDLLERFHPVFFAAVKTKNESRNAWFPNGTIQSEHMFIFAVFRRVSATGCAGIALRIFRTFRSATA